MRDSMLVLVVVLAACGLAVTAAEAQCFHAEQCDEDCPIDPCETDADCSADQTCVQGGAPPALPCLSSSCDCLDNQWVCTADCGGKQCLPEQSVPGVSARGAVVLAALLAAAAVLAVRRRRMAPR